MLILNSQLQEEQQKLWDFIANDDEDGESEIYILLVLKALAQEIQKYGNKMNAATNKYVAKYPKK